MGETKTDAQGRWRLDVAPKDASGVWVSAKHPRYRPRAGESVASLGRDSVTVLKKGLTVTGQVVDAAGRPVKGARAVMGHDIWGTNSADRDDKRAGRVHPGELRPRPDDHHRAGRGLRTADP